MAAEDYLIPGASALTGIVGNILTNKANKQIARQTNALNYRMFNEANAFTERMWNQQNAYNAPIEARKRLEAAGYNPASLLDAQQIGAASSASSAPAPQMQGFTYQNPLGSFPTDMVAFTQALKNANEAKNVDMQTKNYEWQLTAYVDMLQAQKLLTKQQADNLKQEYDLKESTWDDLMKEIHAKAYMTDRQAGIADMQWDLLRSYGAAREEANIDKICAEAFDLIQDGKYKQAARALTEADIGFKQAQIFIDQYRAKTERMVGAATANEMNKRAFGEDLQNQITKEFGRGSAAAKFLIDYYSGKISEPKAIAAEWEKIYRSIPPGQIGALLRYIVGDINPLNGLFK